MLNSITKGDFKNLFNVYITSAKSVPNLYETFIKNPTIAESRRWEMLEMCSEAYSYYLCNYSYDAVDSALITVSKNL